MSKALEVYSYEQALKDSTEYFKGDSLAAKVFIDKYSLRDNEDNILENTPEKMFRRIAKEFARVEKKKFKEPLKEQEIFDLLNYFKYIVPQGSQLFGIGNTYQTITLSNCYVVESPLDSYGSILKADQQIIQICKRRGGAGVNLSHLRPSGAHVKNAARSSTGITSWMERYSNTIREVGQHNRRGALMQTIDVEHMDIENFITVKNDPTKVTGANISVKLSDKFLKAVKEDKEFTLQWPINTSKPKMTKTIRAKELWEKMIHSAWLRAEPGLLFWGNITTNNAVDCYKEDGFETVCTNPCAELPLGELGSCLLMVQNLFSYVVNPFTDKAFFDFELFDKHTKIAQRLMDNVVDLELEKIEGVLEKIKNDPEPENVKRDEKEVWEKVKEVCAKGRRTGLGITAEADMLAALNIKYGSDESIEMCEKVHKAQKLSSFTSSMEMAKEIGAFPIWNWEKEKNSKFLLQIKKECPELYENFSKYGRRNIANLTIAPTGSISLLTQTSSGIEPLFRTTYTRRKKINADTENARVDFIDAKGDKWQEFTVYHPKLKTWMEVTQNTDHTKSPWHNCCSNDLDWRQRVKLQAAVQVHIDHSISSTVNVPNTATEEQVAEIYQTAWESGCKGITVYREGCRDGVLISKDSKHTKEKITKTHAPKRPKELPCDIYHVKITKKLDKVRQLEYAVIVGTLNEDPYEIFAFENGSLDKKHSKGLLIKRSRGHYDVKMEDGTIVENIMKDQTEEEEMTTRLTSTALRHGADISFIVHQLEKVKADSFGTFTKVMARVLKKYIKDGTKVSGEVCPSCGSKNLQRKEGCVSCTCGFAKCG